MKNNDFLEEFSGSRLWRLIDDLGKWSWTSKNKLKIKNIFHARSKEDCLASIQFRDNLNKYLQSWVDEIPKNPNGGKSVFTEAFKKYEKLAK